MRTILTLIAAGLITAAFAAPAQAISGPDCGNTLKGLVGHVGYHGYDNDIYTAEKWYEGTYGLTIVNRYIYDYWRPGGYGNQVGAGVVFVRANGATIGHAFHCFDGRPDAAYIDNSWYRIW